MRSESFGQRNKATSFMGWLAGIFGHKPTTQRPRIFGGRRLRSKKNRANSDKTGHALRQAHFGTFAPVKPLIVNRVAIN
jgi:hypothetical protein